MKRDVQGAVLLLLGLLLMRLALGGSYVNYVKVSMRPILIVTAICILGLAAWNLVSVWRNAQDPDDGHGHSDLSRVAWLMLLPVVVVFVVSPRPLGAYTAARQLATAPIVEDAGELPPLPPGDPVSMPIGEYTTRAVWGKGVSLEDRDITLTGFVTPDPDGGWWLTRLGLACCAADALSFRVRVLDTEAPRSNSWVEVTGRWSPGESGDDGIPLITADAVRQVPQPQNPYE